MAQLRKLIIDGQEADVPEYVPGDNIAFVQQADGTTQINAAGGSGSPYAAGDGIHISDQNVISADVHKDMIAPEDEATALEPHAVGEVIIVGGVTYEVTAAIAVDDAIVEGTNVERTNLGNEVFVLKTNVASLLDYTDHSLTVTGAGQPYAVVDASPPTKSGYKLLGVMGWQIGNASYNVSIRYRKVTNKIEGYVASNGGSAIPSGTSIVVYYGALWMKNVG